MLHYMATVIYTCPSPPRFFHEHIIKKHSEQYILLLLLDLQAQNMNIKLNSNDFSICISCANKIVHYRKIWYYPMNIHTKQYTLVNLHNLECKTLQKQFLEI